MTVGRIVDYDAADKTYSLPPEHAASLTRAAGPGNLAEHDAVHVADGQRWRTTSSSASATAAACPTPSFPTFQELMAEMSADRSTTPR